MRGNLKRYPLPALLGLGFLDHLVSSANAAIDARGRFNCVLSGGSTPLLVYEYMRKPIYQNKFDWEKIFLFWGDERFVPHTDPGSNYGQAKLNLLDHLPIPPQNVFPIPTTGRPEDCATAYVETIKAFGVEPQGTEYFDLTILGLGNDGHTASLFPGKNAEWNAPVIATTAEYENRPSTRITLTPQLLNQSRDISFLVMGASKAPALHTALQEQGDESQYPTFALSPLQGNLNWFVDLDASSGLVNW